MRAANFNRPDAPPAFEPLLLNHDILHFYARVSSTSCVRRRSLMGTQPPAERPQGEKLDVGEQASRFARKRY
jgi:hypothetical protein